MKRGDLLEAGIPVYEQQNAINDNRLFRYYVDDAKFQELKRFQVSAGDIVISCSGTVGKTTIIRENDPMGIISQALLILRVDMSVALPEFLQYYLKTERGLNSLLERSIGSVQTNIAKREVIENIDVPLPSLEEQQAIVRIMASFDDVISNNKKINENLLGILNLSYKRIKDEFPPDYELSDLCIINHNRGSASDLIPFNYYSTENMLPDKGGVTQATSMPSDNKAIICEAGDVLISNIRPYFKKIHYCTERSGCSPDVLDFRAKNPQLAPYLYSILYSDEFFDYVVAGSKGTKMPRGDKGQILQYPIPIPSETILESFCSFGQIILSQIKLNARQTSELIALRDFLLPKLMSGEIDVSTLELPTKYSFEGRIMVSDEVTLGSVCDRIGDGIHGTPAYDDCGDYYFFNGSNIVDGSLLVTPGTKRVGTDEYNRHKRQLGRNTLLLSINGTIGNVARYRGEQCILGKSVAYLNVGSDTSSDYVYYVLKSRNFQEYIKNANGSTIKNVSLDMLRNYSFSLPSTAVQAKIAKILSSLDAQIDNLGRVNDNLLNLLKIDFEQLFEGTEELVQLGTVADIQTGPFGSQLHQEDYVDEGTPLVSVENLGDFHLNRKHLPGIKPEDCKRLSRYLMKEGDIIFSRVGYVDRSSYVSKNEDGWMFSGSCLRIRNNDPAFSLFTYLYLNTIESRETFKAIAVGATRPSINSSILSEFEIEMPVKSVIEQFNLRASNIESMMTNNVLEIEKLSMMRDYLLPKLMSGEIDVSTLETPN